MPRSLPPRPSLEYVRKEAKALLAAHQSGDLSVCDVLRHHHRFQGASDAAILAAGVSLQEVQHALAVAYGFKNWKELRTRLAPVSIRPMKASDDKQVSSLVSECWRLIAEPDGLTEEQLNNMLKERCRPEHIAAIRERFDCWVAGKDRRVAGCVARCGYSIEELFVRPSYHRQGVGTALFEHTEHEVREAGYGKLAVLTTGYGMPFYEAVGMQVVGLRRVTFGPLEGRELTALEKVL